MCQNCGGIGSSAWGKRLRSSADYRKRKSMKPVKPWDLLNKDNWTIEEVRAKRLEICNACEHLNKLRQCKKCMCFVDAKTHLENAFCPLRKW